MAVELRTFLLWKAPNLTEYMQHNRYYRGFFWIKLKARAESLVNVHILMRTSNLLGVLSMR
jgi:hypothetical protein